MTAPASLTVDLNALSHNFHALEALTHVPVHPVVKANAYGLGAIPVAKRLLAEGARTFFVARVNEGVALREAIGAEPTIYVLDGCVAGAAGTLKSADLRPILNHADQLIEWTSVGGGLCGVQIDTGMNRLGFRPEDAPGPFDGLELVMSHLACADAPAEPMNRRQQGAFAAISALYPDAVKSFANSGGCFLGADYAFDAVRPGICLYGGGPEGRPDARLKAVATLSAEILQIRDVPTGESIGYSRGFVADAPRRIATCGAGYADGLLRSMSPRGQVWIAGGLRPLLGRVSMDVMAVDVTGADVAIGDRVEIFGADRPLDDAAAAAGTISYELLTSIGNRCERTYLGQT
ncbi:alanine racemase [Brevundimonas sp. NIBR11]|uniref:alanine racemase n=1 Tax=Brevundimonas sp. NIBR11 TaxID=3015999 RepID=UPI0022F0B2B1|nr:alanine racemase [Brevundimonas sp. NIBR11]WGM31236.1 Alanine racemase, catabolic [Brevundimonas sp. NIBR11]